MTGPPSHKMRIEHVLATSLAICLVYTTGSDVTQTTSADEMSRLTNVTNGLLAQTHDLSVKVDSLKAQLGAKNALINSLTSQAYDRRDQLSNLTGVDNQQGKHLTSLTAYCKNHANGLNTRTTVLETPIAFTLRFRDDDVSNHTAVDGRWQNLVFDFVQYQTGGHYNTTTGYWTAPSTGYYAFFLTIERNHPQEDACVHAYIVRNSNSYLSTTTACPPGYSSSSNSIITWMRAGYSVHVRSTHSQRVLGYAHTAFSGMKLAVN